MVREAVTVLEWEHVGRCGVSSSLRVGEWTGGLSAIGEGVALARDLGG